jgi:gas vesicle protein
MRKQRTNKKQPRKTGRALSGLSLLGGAGVGAVLMYLFDPESGRRRRESLEAMAEHGAESAMDTLRPMASHIMETGGDAVRHGAHVVGETAHDLKGRLGEAWDHASDRAGDVANDWAASYNPAKLRRSAGLAAEGAAGMIASHARRLARRWPGATPQRSATRYAVPAISGAALVVAGATTIYFFDPSRGRRRRARASDLVHRAVSETGDFFYATGRAIAERCHGAPDETDASETHAPRKAAGGQSRSPIATAT